MNPKTQKYELKKQKVYKEKTEFLQTISPEHLLFIVGYSASLDLSKIKAGKIIRPENKRPHLQVIS